MPIDPIFDDKRPLLPERFKKPALIAAGVIVIASIGVVAGSLIASNVLGTRVPETVLQQAKSPIYLPGSLPSGYSVDQSSFVISEDTVLFTATNKEGSKLVFAEQAKPKDFDFDNFHQGQLQEPKALQGTKYTSVWGKAVDNRLFLSVVADDTWITMTTSALLNEGDMRNISQGLRK